MGGGENVPGIPGACATRNCMYLVRGPQVSKYASKSSIDKYHFQKQNTITNRVPSKLSLSLPHLWNFECYMIITWTSFLSIFYISQRLTLWYFVFLYLIFLSQQVLYFLLSTLVLTLYIDVVLSLSIWRSLPTKICDCVNNSTLWCLKLLYFVHWIYSRA